jgi:transposase-like protein
LPDSPSATGASARKPLAAIVQTIFAQADWATAMAQLDRVADGLHDRFPQAAALLEETEEEILAYHAFPNEHPVSDTARTT